MSISIARTESQSSRGSAASGTSAGGISIAGGRGRDSLGADAEGVDQTGALRTAVYGLLFTLSRERWDFNKRWVAARLALEHAQLIVFMLQPQFLWALGYKRRWWIYVGAIIFKPLPALVNPRHPYAASIQMFYAFVALVLAALVGCVFVGGAFLRNGACPPKTRVVRLLRFGCGVLFSTAYVGVLLVLASPINCQFLAADPAKRMRLHDFPTVACAQMPHWPHAAVSMLTVVAAAALSALLSAPHAFWAMGDRHPLAAAHPYVELKAWFFKTVMVLASVLLTGHPQVQPIVIAIAAVWLSYIYIRWEPHYNAWANHLRAALYAAAAAIACVAVALSWPLQRDSPPYQRLLTIVALAAAPAAAAAAGAASWLRVQWGPERAVRAFRWADPADLEGPALKSIHRFPDAFEAELASRVARARAGPWPDSDIDREAAALGEVVLKAALMRFDRSAALCLAHAGLMADLQGNAAGAQSQVQAAKKLDPDWFERYAIFVREQQHMARLQGQQGASSAESALDLAGYVEFNRSYKALLRVHKSALRSIRNFWRNLLRTDVAFADMTRSLMKIDLTRQRADRSYKMLLERYPSNVKVLRAYARFVEDVKHDPWGAAWYHGEADKLEEQEAAGMAGIAGDAALMRGGGALAAAAEGEGEGAGGEGDASTGGAPVVDERVMALCVINSAGTVQMANKNLLRMFGYKKAEVEGKNVAMLMPQPFSGRHNSYLRNYSNTGTAKILDIRRQVVALHRERYVFPVEIFVTKVSGHRNDALYMGAISPAAEDADVVRAWLTTSGATLCVDRRFTDWLGRSQFDCVGRQFSALSDTPARLDALLERAQHSTEAELKSGALTEEGVVLVHKYAGTVSVDITLELGGTDDQRLFVAALRRKGHQDDHLMALNRRGRVIYATTKLAGLLGYDPRDMERLELGRIMAQPFGQLHRRWMEDTGSRPPPRSCRAGAPVVLFTATKAMQPATVEVSTHEVGEELTHIVKVTPRAMPDCLDLRRLSCRLSPAGAVLSVSEKTPASVFGFAPAELIGRGLQDFLDVFKGLPERAAARGAPDMETVLGAMARMVLDGKVSSWRCGVRPPCRGGGGGGGGEGAGAGAGAAGTAGAAGAVAAAQSALQAVLIANQTRAARMELEVEEADEEHGGPGAVGALTLHLWRAEMVTSVVEVDRDANITKAGCCALHQPSLVFGVPSNQLLRTPLSRWVNVPPTFDGMLLDDKRPHRAKGAKGHHKHRGALKKSAADVKVGPLRHCVGVHVDGGPLYCTVQSVVKDGVAAGQTQVVKITVERPSKGSSDFVRQVLGLIEMPKLALPSAVAARTSGTGWESDGADATAAAGAGATPHPHRQAAASAAGAGPPRGSRAGGVKFAGGGGSDDDQGGLGGAPPAPELDETDGPGAGGGGGGGFGFSSPQAAAARGRSSGGDGGAMARSASSAGGGGAAPRGGGAGAPRQPSTRLPSGAGQEGASDWAPSAHGSDDAATEADGGVGPDPAADGFGAVGDAASLGAPPDEAGSQVSGGEEGSSAQGGSDAGGYRTDYRRGKRLRKLARVLMGRRATYATRAFNFRGLLLIAGLLLAHTVCFGVSLWLLQGLNQYIYEVDDAGTAIIGLHRMLIDCRVLDELHAGVNQPGIFVSSDLPMFVDLAKDAINIFAESHDLTYLGRKQRRFVNRVTYKLRDYWETPMWNATLFFDTGSLLTPVPKGVGLWELGNDIAASSREVAFNHETMAAGGRLLSENRHWMFVTKNSPWAAYQGYRVTLFGLVERALAKIDEVTRVMDALLSVEACTVFTAAAAFMLHLIQKACLQRYNVFNAFLALPAGFLRALASKQVQLDEDDESDEDEDDAAAALHTQAAEATEGQQAATLQVSASRKGGAGAGGGRLIRPPPTPAWQKALRALNPLQWFGTGELNIDTGKKRLRRSRRDAALMVGPVLLWAAALAITYGVTIEQLKRVSGPFQMLNMINFLVFRVTRNVVFSLETCTAETADQKLLQQEYLSVRHRDFVADYNSFLYGVSVLQGLHQAAGADNPLAVDIPAIFQDHELSRLFFRADRCLRVDQSTCYPPDHPFYAATHSGIDAMATRFMFEVEALIRDPPDAVNMSSPRMPFIWQVGRKDLFDGMTQANLAFRHQVENIFASLQTLHAIIYAASVAFAAGIALALVRPFMRRNRQQTRQVAELLSQLPPEMDVESLVALAIARDGDEEGGGSGAAAGGAASRRFGSSAGAMAAVAGGGGGGDDGDGGFEKGGGGGGGGASGRGFKGSVNGGVALRLSRRARERGDEDEV